MSEIRLRRVYEEALPEDGTRVLVDRLWPRGVAKEAAHLDEWVRAVAPSEQLRRWYGHLPDRFPEFRHRYLAELASPERAQALAHLQEIAGAGTLTLLTGTRNAAQSQAAVLLDLLNGAQTGDDPVEEGGDPACWQKRVCPNCGTLADTDPPTWCQQCHEGIPG
jgi:uncharacterized protein YeaO (DUF488 family)